MRLQFLPLLALACLVHAEQPAFQPMLDAIGWTKDKQPEELEIEGVDRDWKGLNIGD